MELKKQDNMVRDGVAERHSHWKQGETKVEKDQVR